MRAGPDFLQPKSPDPKLTITSNDVFHYYVRCFIGLPEPNRQKAGPLFLADGVMCTVKWGYFLHLFQFGRSMLNRCTLR
ncbi:unnamed protein product [Tenebrio molitor]|nr:unnamed protein product [Tenebrio molitor]